jgi:hypothetical protein
MSNFKRREIVDFINRQKLGTAEAEEAVARLRAEFPGITTDEMKAALQFWRGQEMPRAALR